MKYKVLVLDIDGTLCDSQKVITQPTKDAISKLQDQGVTVVIASGRPVYGVMPSAKELKLEQRNGYILAFNGGRIINCTTDEIIVDTILPDHFAPRIEKMAREYGCSLMSYEGNQVITINADDQYVQLEARINGLPVKQIKSFEPYATYPMNKMIVTGDGDYLEKLEPVFAKAFPELNVYRSEPFFLEMLPKGIDKAKSLSVLLKHLHLTREEMVACGDGFNDKTMIEYAGMGVAMANAQDAVKEVADFVTKSNDEDGVVYAIEKLFYE